MSENTGSCTERNLVVAFLARLYPSGTRATDIPGWDPDWHHCVYIDLPSGQVSYHYHDRDVGLFAALPPYVKPYDGHTKEQADERIRECIQVLDASRQAVAAFDNQLATAGFHNAFERD